MRVIFGSLRKCWVLAAIFCSSLMYFVYFTFSLKRKPNEGLLVQRLNQRRNTDNLLNQLKLYKSRHVHGNFTGVQHRSCRNSIQGKVMIVDEQGYVCLRESVLLNGCCDTDSSNTTRHDCASCRPWNCCAVYEHCVSCCMRADKRALLEKMIRETDSNPEQVMFSSVSGLFELCLSKCRTSSTSVQHENKYRDADFKHCFGKTVPNLKTQ